MRLILSENAASSKSFSNCSEEITPSSQYGAQISSMRMASNAEFKDVFYHYDLGDPIKSQSKSMTTQIDVGIHTGVRRVLP